MGWWMERCIELMWYIRGCCFRTHAYMSTTIRWTVWLCKHLAFKMSMITSSNENIFRVTGPLCREFTGHRWFPLTKSSDAELWCFLWSAPWINGWVNIREADDLRHRRAHYDVIVMGNCLLCIVWSIALSKMVMIKKALFDMYTFWNLSQNLIGKSFIYHICEIKSVRVH